ncbi:MAG: ABC transporter permease [bacterium]|nr:ABC transporter permease [bacterium]
MSIKNSKGELLLHLLYGSAGFVLLILVWQVAGLLFFTGEGYGQFHDFLPRPAFKALYGLFTNPVFWSSVFASLRRVLVGLFIAFIIGFSMGVLLGYSAKLRRLTNLPLQFVRMVSPLAWMPIAILVLPAFEHAIYFLILMASMWPVMHNTSQGIQDVPSSWIAMARIQGANRFQLLTRVLLPSATPHILGGMRLALGIAWIILVPAEYLGINKGLGYLINDARDTMEYDRLMALVLAIGILGFILDSLFVLIRRKFDWRKTPVS